MKVIRNDCCGCSSAGYACMGSSCPLRHVEHHYCDICGAEEKLYPFNGQELCLACIEVEELGGRVI